MHINLAIGNKVDALVKKFAMILLQRMRDKRDQKLQKASRNIEETLINKLHYLDTVKTAKPTMASLQTRKIVNKEQ